MHVRPHIFAIIFESLDRKSTRLNSSHANISYAVFCLKKKNFPSIVLLSGSVALTPNWRRKKAEVLATVYTVYPSVLANSIGARRAVDHELHRMSTTH